MKRSIVLALVSAWLLSACGTPAVENNPSSLIAAGGSTATEFAQLPEEASVVPPYVINAGDELAIKFYLTPELDDTLQVQPDGFVNLRLVGSIKAEGKTPAQMTTDLQGAYGAELENPQIAVIVQNIRDFQVFVGGEVDRQQAVDLTPGMTPFEAIMAAGGASDGSDLKSVVLIRRSASGQPVPYEINLKTALNGGTSAANLRLQPLDIVYVPKSRIARLHKFVQDYVQNLFLIRGISAGYDLDSNL